MTSTTTRKVEARAVRVLFNLDFTSLFMVHTFPVGALVRPNAKVRQLGSDGTDSLVWVEGHSTCCFASMDDNGGVIEPIIVAHGHRVTTVKHLGNEVVVGDETQGVTWYSTKGEVLATCSLDAGVLLMDAWGSGVAVVDGLGQLLVVQRDCSVENLTVRFDLEECTALLPSNDSLYVIGQSGRVQRLLVDRVAWTRSPRGHHGERITGFGLDAFGGLVLAREGHALVGGEEEPIELERWVEDRLVSRQDIDARLLVTASDGTRTYLGFDDGTVREFSREHMLSEVLSTGHPVFSLLVHGGHVLASSWFYIHGVDGDGQAWRLEHQGMPTHLVPLGEDVLVFAGDDQNDYTAPEPIGTCRLTDERQEVDPTELSSWFEADGPSKQLTAEELYGEEDEAVLSLLSDDEQASMTGTDASEDVLTDLLADLAADEAPSPATEPVVVPEEGMLMPALDGTLDAADPGDVDLLATLSAVHETVEAPRANAGDDRTVEADEDGTAKVLLDGRGTHDPHGLVTAWSWLDAKERELATTAQVELRLPIGVFAFDLRVLDANGIWTTDRVTVRVETGSTS